MNNEEERIYMHKHCSGAERTGKQAVFPEYRVCSADVTCKKRTTDTFAGGAVQKQIDKKQSGVTT